MDNVRVLDATLRDGGCVIDFNFGKRYMFDILSALESSGVDIIELGYIDEKKGSLEGRTQYLNEKIIPSSILKNKKKEIEYVAMIDYGKYSFEKLSPCTLAGIDGIRLAFHKEDKEKIIDVGKQIIDKGYNLYIQPMISTRYSDLDLLELIEIVNDKLPNAKAFYIVDSFGEMRNSDIVHLIHLIDKNLNIDIELGFHSHNNLQLSYSNAMSILTFTTDRRIILDSCVMGMGKGAGNLNTELLLEHLNLYSKKQYKIGPLLKLIDQVINVIHEEKYWGYSIEYYLSSIHHCTPSYASYLHKKNMLSIEQLDEILELIPMEKKISFDQNFIEQLYRKYNSSQVINDIENVEEISTILKGKKVLLIAPGKSLLKYEYDTLIKEKMSEESIISIALNNMRYNTDFTMITRREMVKEALNSERKIIFTSNVCNINRKNIFVLNYDKWIVWDGITHDSAGEVILNFIKSIEIKEIFLAGFDGFSININENYYDANMRHTITEEQAKYRNDEYRKLIYDISKKIKLTFITPSVYTVDRNVMKDRCMHS